MRIYRAKVDSNNVQWIIPRISEDKMLDLLTFDCQIRSDNFINVNWYIFNPKQKKANFYTGITGALVFDQEVYDSEIFTLFETSGQILPIKIETGEKLYVLNVLEYVNLLNVNKTIWDIYNDGQRGRILQYFFYENVSESSIFKIPETSRVEILTYSGKKDPADEFYSLYKQLGFKGLVFEELYPLMA